MRQRWKIEFPQLLCPGIELTVVTWLSYNGKKTGRILSLMSLYRLGIAIKLPQVYQGLGLHKEEIKSEYIGDRDSGYSERNLKPG